MAARDGVAQSEGGGMNFVLGVMVTFGPAVAAIEGITAVCFAITDRLGEA